MPVVVVRFRYFGTLHLPSILICSMTRQLPTFYMVGHHSFYLHYCSRSSGGHDKVSLFSPGSRRANVENSCGGFCNRIYVITGMNKLISLALSALIVAQLSLGIYSVVWAAMRPGRFLSQLPVPAHTQIRLQHDKCQI